MTLVQTRIYRPLTVAELRRLGAEGAVGPEPFTAYAVTTALRGQHPGADEEELEYLAFTAAAAALSGAVRVVAAADVDQELVTARSDGGPVTGVRVAVAVPRRAVVSFHVPDPADAPRDEAVAGGMPELSWYDATELDVVVDLLG